MSRKLRSKLLSIWRLARLLGEVCEVIKADIIDKVARNADITKVKAVVAVEAVLDAMKASMQRG